jgi:hypothetical protein
VRSCERGPAGLRRAKRMRIRAGGGKVWHPPCPSSGRGEERRGEERRGRSCCLRWRHESTILRARILVILGYHSLALHRSIPRLQTLAPSQPRLPFHRSTHLSPITHSTESISLPSPWPPSPWLRPLWPRLLLRPGRPSRRPPPSPSSPASGWRP